MSRELMLAIFNNEKAKVEEFLKDSSIDINYRHVTSPTNPDKEVTPLIMAASKGYVEIIELLLADKRLDPLAVSGIGRSALSVAAAYGHVKACELLLPVSDVTAVDQYKATAYSQAFVNHRSCKDELLSRKLQEVIDFLRIPTFEAVCGKNNLRLVKWMVENDKIEAEDVLNVSKQSKELYDYFFSVPKFQVPMFVQAAIDNDIAAIEKLVELGVDINGQYKNFTALQIACMKCYSEIAIYLLSLPQIQLNIQCPHDGSTALHLLCLTKTGKALANPHAKENDEQTERIFLANSLIKRGIDIDRKDSSGQSAFYKAIIYNQLDLVKFLVLKGADLNERIPCPEHLKKDLDPLNQGLDLVTLSKTSWTPEVHKYLKDIKKGRVEVRNLQKIANYYFLGNANRNWNTNLLAREETTNTADEQSASLAM